MPYRINVADATLTDVKERLAKTRFPSEIDNSGWDYGTNLAYLKELVTYWRTTFNWREQERRLNQLPSSRRPSTASPFTSSTSDPRIRTRRRW